MQVSPLEPRAAEGTTHSRKNSVSPNRHVFYRRGEKTSFTQNISLFTTFVGICWPKETTWSKSISNSIERSYSLQPSKLSQSKEGDGNRNNCTTPSSFFFFAPWLSTVSRRLSEETWKFCGAHSKLRGRLTGLCSDVMDGFWLEVV